MRKLTQVVSRREVCCPCLQGAREGNLCVDFHPSSFSSPRMFVEMKERGTLMEVLYDHCCGLDVHKKTVVACVMITSPNGRVQKSVRTFGTTTADILELLDWIDTQQVSHLALESTGIFWRPLYNLLEEGHTIILVNAHHMKAVPGRKVRREVA